MRQSDEANGKFKRSGKKVSRFVHRIVDLAESQGNPNQLSLIETQPMSLTEIVETARREVREQDVSGNLSKQETVNNEPASEEQGAKNVASEDPVTGEDKEYNRLEKVHGHNVAAAFTDVAPLVAERLAIAEYKEAHPEEEIGMIAPEVNSLQEAAEIASMERRLTMEETQKVLDLLRTDPTMEEIVGTKQKQ